MKIATWNINGVRARLETLLAWLGQAQPDIACLQEIKTLDDGFPREAVEALGYNIATHGQKGFNGVALLSKQPFDEVSRSLPGGDGDEQSRFIEGVFRFGSGVVRVASIYLPNGNPVGTDKFAYKLAWLRRLEAWAQDRLALEEPLVVCGDYNVIPEPEDCHDPAAWSRDALFQPESREAYRRLLNLGLVDAIRAVSDSAGVYTFWDYQAGAWQKNHGIRIDHHLLGPEAASRLAAAGIDRQTRAWEKPSDHVPAWIELREPA